MNEKPINFDRDYKIIKRYLDITKPSGVSDIEFELRPTGDKDEYFMSIMYIVPDGSKYLSYVVTKNVTRNEWNYQIIKDIQNYFGLRVIINNSGTRSEKFNYGK
jgi:hypothetical protein